MYNTGMRFEVPQFIDIEDKIFGPLTWRQFLYLGGGIGMGVVLFLTAHILVFLFIGLPLAVAAGALAFFPVNNRPFIFFLESIFNYLMSSKLYLWRHKQDEVHIYKNNNNTTLLTSALIKAHEPKLNNPAPSVPTNSFARRLELEVMQKSD